MMKKTLFAILMIISISCGFIVNVYAAEDLGDLWAEKRSNVTEEEGYIHLDKKEAYDGNASLRIYFKNAYKSNTYVKLESTQSVSFDPDKTYIFECYAKSAGGSSRAFGKLVWDWTALGNIEVSSTDWTYFSKTFKPDTTSNKFGIVFEGQSDGWIDCLSIRVLDEDGYPTGINMLENGSFEAGDQTAPGDITGIDTDGRDGTVILSWTNPDDEDFAAVNIYEFDEESESLIATVVPDGGSAQFRIEGLENGSLHYYRLCARDAAWNESNGVEIYGAPVIDRYYSTPIIALAGAEEAERIQAGEIAFSTEVTNNRGGADFNATLITAVYDGMRLLQLEVCQKVIAENEEERLETVVSIPENHENFRIESYLWSDAESMESLYQSKILTE